MLVMSEVSGIFDVEFWSFSLCAGMIYLAYQNQANYIIWDKDAQRRSFVEESLFLADSRKTFDHG